MKGSDLFDAMNDLPADVVAAAEASPDARDAGGYGVTTRQKRREAFTRVTTSGWFIAAVSLIVAFGVVALIVRAGRTNPGITPSAGSAGNGDFTFSYELPDGDTYTAGESVRMTASVTNHGAPFAYEGGSGDFVPHAELKTPTGQRLVFSVPLREDWGTFTVGKGETGTNHGYTLTLPADAPVGDYDLILSYGTSSVTFAGAVRVTDKAGSFTFSYEFPDRKSGSGTYTCLQTDTIRVNVSMTYKGLPRPVQTSSSGPMPSAHLVHQTTGFILPLDCLTPADVVTSVLTPGKTYTMPGELYGIPETAPAGVYDLVASYGDSSKTFKAALTLVAAGQTTVENYTFGYQMERTIFEPGETFNLITYLTNNGSPLTISGRSSDLLPEAYLVIHVADTAQGSGKVREYRLTAARTPSDEPYGSVTLETGATATGYLTFTIPPDAPVGIYEMDFMFRGVTCVFPARVEVAADVNHPMRDSEEEFGTRVTEPRYDDDFIGEGTPGLGYAEDTHFIQSWAVAAHDRDVEMLTEIRVPAEYAGRTVTSIARGAFDECLALTVLYLPKGVGYIEDGAFLGCPNLAEIHYQGYTDAWEAIARESEYWNAGLPNVAVVCRNGTLYYDAIGYDLPETDPPVDPVTPPLDPIAPDADSPVTLFCGGQRYFLPGMLTAREYYDENTGMWAGQTAEVDLSEWVRDLGGSLPTVTPGPSDVISASASHGSLRDPDLFDADMKPLGTIPLSSDLSLDSGTYYLFFRLTDPALKEESLYAARIVIK